MKLKTSMDKILDFVGYAGLALMIFIGYVYYIRDVLIEPPFYVAFTLIILFLFASASLSVRILNPHFENKSK